MRINPVTLKVLENHAQAVAESMAWTLFRTAHSTFVKETEDFSCGLLTPEGMTFASPRDIAATWYPALDYGRAIALIDHYEEGDVCITNDPYSGNLCTHTPDMHIWKPIFWEGELIAFAAGHIHNTDMGGAVPASLSRANTEVHQEGIRFKPSKLISGGVMNQELVDTMLLNVRMPEQNWGDLKAQIASVNIGEKKVHEMIRKFGVDTVRDGIQDILDVAEKQARAVIEKLPDGVYHFVDYLDEDGPGGDPVRIELNMHIKGDSIVMDLTGSDPQLKASLNMPTGGNPRHILLLVGYNYCMYTLDPTMPLNGGMIRPVECILPEGSVLNATEPAAVGMRSLTCTRLQGVTNGAFYAAAPHLMPVGAAGGGGIVNVKTYDNRSGRMLMASIDPVTGGAGGSALGDGTDGSGGAGSFLKNTPVEINEVEVPLKFLRYGLEQDSGGAGYHRGGMATVLEVQVFSPDSVVTARNRDRSIFASWGGQGGLHGSNSHFTRTTPEGEVFNLGNTDVVPLGPGDVFNLTSGGGAGWGDPLMRPADLVKRDVARGAVSPEVALRDYGVVIVDGTLDEAATEELRMERARDGEPPLFTYNKGRIEYESVWTDANYAVLTEVLSQTPIHWRHFVKSSVFDQIRKMPAEALRGDGSEVRAAVNIIAGKLPQLAVQLGLQVAAE